MFRSVASSRILKLIVIINILYVFINQYLSEKNYYYSVTQITMFIGVFNIDETTLNDRLKHINIALIILNTFIIYYYCYLRDFYQDLSFGIWIFLQHVIMNIIFLKFSRKRLDTFKQKRNIFKYSSSSIHLIIINLIRYLAKVIFTQIFPLMNNKDTIWMVGSGCLIENTTQGRSYVDKNIDFSDCFFLRSSTFSGSGGVIYVSGGIYSMIVNYSMFYKCVCSTQGGAIYFSSTNSFLRMICANSCYISVSNYYHFAYLNASQENQVEYLSVSNCSHNTASGYYSIYLDSGN